MRALLDWYLQWHPPIMHDLHESVPFLYTFSGQAPQNPTLDPILYGELPMFANFEMTQMTKYGMPGVWTHGFVDMWSPGYLAFMSSNHNGMVRMYETFGNGGATTMKRTMAPPRAPRQRPTGTDQPRVVSARPPYKEVEWSMRNNTNYMQTGVLSALAVHVGVSRRSSSRTSTEEPQLDRGGQEGRAVRRSSFRPARRTTTRVALLVNLLRVQGIEVGRATARDEADGRHVSRPGSFVVKRDQPYGRLAKILLEKQNFPDPTLRTYDDTGWTMGLMLQTEVKAIADKAILDVAVEPVTRVEPRRSALTGAARRGVSSSPNHGANAHGHAALPR